MYEDQAADGAPQMHFSPAPPQQEANNADPQKKRTHQQNNDQRGVHELSFAPKLSWLELLHSLLADACRSKCDSSSRRSLLQRFTIINIAIDLSNETITQGDALSYHLWSLQDISASILLTSADCPLPIPLSSPRNSHASALRLTIRGLLSATCSPNSGPSSFPIPKFSL